MNDGIDGILVEHAAERRAIAHVALDERRRLPAMVAIRSTTTGELLQNQSVLGHEAQRA